MAQPSKSFELPRFEAGRQMMISGYNAHYTMETRSQIPAQWQRFAPLIGRVPNQVGTASYGVCWKVEADQSFDYLCGVEVNSNANLPPDFQTVELAPQRYAVFTHHGHYTELPKLFQAIWQDWLPASGCAVVSAPVFERYSEEFNPETGCGGTEVWVPVRV